MTRERGNATHAASGLKQAQRRCACRVAECRGPVGHESAQRRPRVAHRLGRDEDSYVNKRDAPGPLCSGQSVRCNVTEMTPDSIDALDANL